MFNTAQRNHGASRHPHEELEEIVSDLPSSSNHPHHPHSHQHHNPQQNAHHQHHVHGPASITEHVETAKIISSNPDDLSRVRKIKHFQEYVVGVTKNGIYFAIESLEKMFPPDAPHTKILLGSCNVIKLLKDCGGTVTKDQKVGPVLNFALESLVHSKRPFQDPFSAFDLPTPKPLVPFSAGVSTSSASGLLVGATANVPFWQSFLVGTGNMWETLTRTGVKPFFSGLIVGFVDEVLGSLVPERFRDRLTYIKNVLKSATALIGTTVLCVLIIDKQVTLISAILTVLISYVGNIVGGTVGSALCRLLKWVMQNTQRGSELSLPQHVTMPLPAASHATRPDTQHICGLDNNGFMNLGLCINCNIQPALFGFVHRKDDVAHSAFCLSCSALYRKTTCVCHAEVSSTYYFSLATPTCHMKACVRVADCVKCDEEDVEVKRTAVVWRLKKTDESKLSLAPMACRAVTLDLRYCVDHLPRASATDMFRYGKLYSTGYM